MQHYVLTFCGTENCFIALEKEKPEWQKGRINLVGGKVEPGESPKDAALREFQEETGIAPHRAEYYGEIFHNNGMIHVYKIWYAGNQQILPTDYEQPFWTNLQELLHFDNRPLIPNLQVIIPLLICGVKGWVIQDDQSSVAGKPHTFTITVPNAKKDERNRS